MKKLTQLFLIAGFILAGHCFTYGQYGKIALQHSGNVTTFTDLTAAITASVNGDTLYLPGGTIFASGSTITIYKSLTIFGAGHYPDSTTATSQTLISKNIYINTGADGGLLCGVKCNSLCFGNSVDNQNVNNFRIIRCYIGTFTPAYSGQSTSQNILISENVVVQVSTSSGFSSVLYEKNIFHYFNISPYSATFNNNIFYVSDYYFMVYGSSVGLFNNNIIIYSQSAPSYNFVIGSSNTVFNNTLFSWIYYTSGIVTYNGTFTSRIGIEKATDTFINATTATFSYSNNYHLNPTSIGHNAGGDGTDVGIYGTLYPCKDGAVPSNPHIISKNIGIATNPTGTLNVDIKVSAQDR